MSSPVAVLKTWIDWPLRLGVLLGGRARCRRVWVLALLLVVCAGCRAAPGTPALGPDEVTTAFYRWYLGYPGNVLVDAAYRTSPYLSQRLIAAVDEALASPRPGGGDPFLLAQDIPERFEIADTAVDGDSATVLLHLSWRGNPSPVARLVTLALVEGEWRIVSVDLG